MKYLSPFASFFCLVLSFTFFPSLSSLHFLPFHCPLPLQCPFQQLHPINDALFTLLMKEAFSYLQTNVKGVSQLEQRLRDLGLQTGRKCLEIFAFRQRLFKRQTAAATSQNTRIELLGWVSGEFWRWLF